MYTLRMTLNFLFSVICRHYAASELARILMNQNIDLQRICHVQPLGVTKNAIIDVDDVLFSDLKADDLGSWSPKSTYFSMSGGVIRIASGKQSCDFRNNSYYILTRRYYTHGTYHLFRRILIDIQGNDNLGAHNSYIACGSLVWRLLGQVHLAVIYVYWR